MTGPTPELASGIPGSGIQVIPDLPICQTDLPLDWYQAEFKPYAENIDRFELADRMQAIELDMLAEPFPDGFDAVMFSNVLHDWEPFRCVELLRKAFDAVPAGGRVYVHESLLDEDGGGPATTASLSLRMLLGTRGSQFPFAGLADLLAQAGFRDQSVTHTWAYCSVVMATKPGGEA